MNDRCFSANLHEALESALRQLRGNDFKLHALRPLNEQGSGSSAQTALASDGKEQYFVKLLPASAHDQLLAESDGLLALGRCPAFRVPQPLACGLSTDGDLADRQAFLVSEYLPLQAVQPENGARAAEALAALHQLEGEQFGWHRDNWLGNSPQSNPFASNWALFFAEHRLRPQFERARALGHERELIRQGERLYARVPALFLDYRPRPSLLHGDLWHGNIAQLADGSPVIFDPAVHYGDRESDLAMSELFGGLPASFYAAYRRQWPLDDDYELRKPLYSLYHILNHLNLFCRSYLREAMRLATRLNEMLTRRRD